LEKKEVDGQTNIFFVYFIYSVKITHICNERELMDIVDVAENILLT
jgi:hypothetical protein